MICVKYHPAPEVCRCEPYLVNGKPIEIEAGGVVIPVTTDDVRVTPNGKLRITIDLSGCCDFTKGLALANGYEMVIDS